jgi:membrane associated rhomboid family serine protease
MPPLPEVTKNLLIINILMFIAQLSIEPLTYYLALYTPGFSSNFQPFQFVSYMFLHSPNNITHLFFNMLALFMFGRDIEYALGAKKFLLFYLAAGLGAGLLHSGVQYWEFSQLLTENSLAAVQEYANRVPTLGASGSIFGLLAAFAMLYPNRMIMLLIPPIPLKAKYFVLIYGILELSMGVAGSNTGVAHFAHIGGAVVGVLMILFWRARGERF